MQVNISESEIIRSRLAVAGSFGQLDAKRTTAWVSYGYTEALTFDHFLAAYERNGVAHGAVHRIVDGCWSVTPRIKTDGSEDETSWEKKTGAILKAVNAWAKLKDFDRRNLIGRYAGLIYRVNDGLPLNQPLVRAAKLVDLVPVYEGQLKVTAWNSDTTSPDYGKPSMYQYRKRNLSATDTQGQPDEWADVHPSRVQILAEGSANGDMFDGVPLLRAGFNSLVDIEKVQGGSAESFLKNSSRVLTFDYDPMASPEVRDADGQKQTVKEAHESIARGVNTNIDASVVTQGAKVGTLQTTIADPTNAFLVAANIFASSVRLPFTILFGQQTGRLASDQDKADAVARYKGRQADVLTTVIQELVTRLQAIGIIDAGAFEVEWPDIAAPSDKEKYGLAEMLAKISDATQKQGQGVAFTIEELRTVCGFAANPELDALNKPSDETDTPDAQDKTPV